MINKILLQVKKILRINKSNNLFLFIISTSAECEDMPPPQCAPIPIHASTPKKTRATAGQKSRQDTPRPKPKARKRILEENPTRSSKRIKLKKMD